MKSARRLMAIAVTMILLSACVYVLRVRRTAAAATEGCCDGAECCC
jgi:hypothetical protein